MDLNYLFLRQQMERSLARAASSDAARAAHEQMARQYELEIERMSGGRIAFPSHGFEQVSVTQIPSASS